MRRPSPIALYLPIAVVTLAAAISSRAEDSTPKEELAWELIQVAGGGDMAQQISTVMLASMHQNYATMVQRLLASQPSLTSEQRAAIEARLANYDRFAQKFSARLMEEIDFDELLRSTYVPLYSDNFTEAELREILAFQESAVGRKAARLMPMLMQEGMNSIIPTVQPVVVSVIERILREEQSLALQQQ